MKIRARKFEVGWCKLGDDVDCIMKLNDRLGVLAGSGVVHATAEELAFRTLGSREQPARDKTTRTGRIHRIELEGRNIYLSIARPRARGIDGKAQLWRGTPGTFTEEKSHSTNCLQKIVTILQSNESLIDSIMQEVTCDRCLCRCRRLKRVLVIEILSEAKSLKRSISLLIFLVLFSVAAGGLASAQCPVTTPANNFCLTGVGNGNNLYGIYVSPYVATVNGVVGTYVICDDFADEVELNESWTVAQNTVGSAASNGLFSSSTAIDPTTGYEEVAWLSQQLITGLPSLTAYQQQVYSYAIWSVFDANGTPSNPIGVNQVIGTTGTFYNDVQTELGDAANAVEHGTTNFSNVAIYTPTGGETCCGPAQEFVTVNTPEAPSVANLAVDFLGLGVLLFAFQRYRLARR